MLENILTTKNCSVKVKLTVKSCVSAGLVLLAVVLPQLVHFAAGVSGGSTWLPMYLPVLLAGCLLGVRWGLGVGLLSPLVSFLLTSAAGNPMPAAARLPFMMAELGVFAVVSGLFAGKIAGSGWMAFPAVLLAQLAGRAAFMLLAVIFQSVAPFTPAMVWAQIQTGLIGLLAQAVLAPVIVAAVRRLLVRDGRV